MAENSSDAETKKKRRLNITRKNGSSANTYQLDNGIDRFKAIDFNSLGTSLTYFFSFFIFLTVAAATLYYVAAGSKNEFHSDCTDTLMWANASYESGSVYDPNFRYACFLPFGVNLIMQPLIHLFGLSLTTHLIGMAAFFIIITAFMFLMQVSVGMGLRSAALGTSVFLAVTLSSKKLREIFWGHTIYYTLGILFLLIGITLYFNLIKTCRQANRKSLQDRESVGTVIHITLLICGLALFIMFAATDGISAISIFTLPFMAAIAAEFFTDIRNRLTGKRAFRTVTVLISIGIMTMLGIILNQQWVGDLTAGYQDANSMYSSMDTWPEHVRKLPMAWLSLLGAESMEGQKLMEGSGLNNLFYIINALFLAVIPVIATCFYTKYQRNRFGKAIRYWIWIHWAVTSIVLLGYICGVLSVAEWRLTPVFGTALILSILFIRWALLQNKTISRIAVILALPAVIVSCMNTMNTVHMPSDPHENNDLFGLTDLLEDMELCNGYATFWQTNAVTVISGNKVKVREIVLKDNVIAKRHYQSSKQWFKDMEGKQKYFLLLTEYEYRQLKDKGADVIKEADEDLETEVNEHIYHILVFDHNIV